MIPPAQLSVFEALLVVLLLVVAVALSYLLWRVYRTIQAPEK